MNEYEVSVKGIFRKEYTIKADSVENAEKQAKDLLDKEIGLLNEDYVVDSISTSQVDF